jgi:hypothetical protein
MNYPRLLLLAVVAAVAPNCDGGGDGPKLLYKDDFSGGTWAVLAGAGTVGADNASGTPAPSMQLTGNGAITGVGTPSFDSTKGFTITVDLQHDNGAQGALYLTNAGNNAIYTKVDIGTSFVGYGTDPTGANLQTDNPAITDDANFHTFVIKIDRNGTVTWKRDGILHHTVTGMPDATYLMTYIVGASGSIRMDSVRVTQP